MSEASLLADARRGLVGAQVALAARMDAKGQHREAVDWLARAAEKRYLPAVRQLGIRLLFGHNAPANPAQGMGMLKSAIEGGDGDAATFFAVLMAMGQGTEKDWPGALDMLATGAANGSQHAREQLDLAAAELRVEAPPAKDPARWRWIARQISVDRWRAAPAPRLLSETPDVRHYPAVLSHRLCKWMIDQARPRLERALVRDPLTGREIMGKTRTNRLANVPLIETTLLNLLVQEKLTALAGVPLDHAEAFVVLNYRPGEQASDHFDFIDPELPSAARDIQAHGQRIVTVLVYLNDKFEGGETAFPELGIAHRGKAGDALFFKSVGGDELPDPRTLHAGRPPTRGEKWVLSQFIRSKPQF